MSTNQWLNAQIYAEPFVGYQLDIRNGFNQLAAGAQVSITTGDYHELLIMYRTGWQGAATTGSDSAFTLNSNLPIYSAASKSIRGSGHSFAIGHRFLVTKPKKPDAIALLLYTGIAQQQIDVKYAYDQGNYTILNPDQTAKKTGFYLGFGVEYQRRFKVGRVFTQIFISTPPSLKNIAYPSRFGWVVPLAINIGYSIQIKKHTYGKRK